MKRFASACLFAMMLTALFLAGCAQSGTDGSDGKMQIVTTVFPEYDWVRNVLGDNPADAQIMLLTDNGVDLHSYQPSVEDILRIKTCDLFIYVGGESDAWVSDALQDASEDMVVIKLLDVLGDTAKEEETVEGMQSEEEDDDESDEPEYDEHVWLSLRNAKEFVSSIADAMGTIDAEHAEMYENNAADYIVRLDELDAEYQKAVRNSSYNTLLFGDRFPFRYLVDDYGLSYYAAFAGCSAETGASFETITFLTGKLDELDLPAVMTIDGSDGKIAETVIRSSQKKDRQILTLDSMQSLGLKDAERGITYLSVMQDNLLVLKKALN